MEDMVDHLFGSMASILSAYQQRAQGGTMEGLSSERRVDSSMYPEKGSFAAKNTSLFYGAGGSVNRPPQKVSSGIEHFT